MRGTQDAIVKPRVVMRVDVPHDLESIVNFLDEHSITARDPLPGRHLSCVGRACSDAMPGLGSPKHFRNRAAGNSILVGAAIPEHQEPLSTDRGWDRSARCHTWIATTPPIAVGSNPVTQSCVIARLRRTSPNIIEPTKASDAGSGTGWIWNPFTGAVEKCELL